MLFTIIILIWIIYLIVYYMNDRKNSFNETFISKDKTKWLWKIPSFLSEHECDHLIYIASKKGLKKSEIKDNKTDDSNRISETCWLSPSSDIVIQKIYDKIEQILQIPQKQFEMLQVVHYKPGGFFKWHYDQCHDHENWCKKEIEKYE